MNYYDFLKEQNKAFDFLNTLDLDAYFENWKDVFDIMAKIEEDYKGKFSDGLIFNCISSDDFMDYVMKKYPNIKFNESTHYYVYRLEG